MSTSLLTTRQVAAWLNVSSETVLRRARAGALPSFRIASNALRFDEAEIAAWLEQTRTPEAGGGQPRSASDPGKTPLFPHAEIKRNRGVER